MCSTLDQVRNLAECGCAVGPLTVSYSKPSRPYCPPRARACSAVSGKSWKLCGPLAAGLGGAGGRGGVEHVLEHGRVLGAVGAVAEVAGDVNRADRAHGLDPVIAGGGAENIAAGGADAEGADAVGVNVAAGGEEGGTRP